MRLLTVLLLAFTACENEGGFESISHAREREWNEPCHDQSSLLATTAGSPNQFVCPNKNHRMEVQVATHPSNEEAAALVFCRCVREGEERDR